MARTVCVVCGGWGFSAALEYCQKCQIWAVHRYCLAGEVPPFDEDVVWFCKDCEPKPSSDCPQAKSSSRRLKKRIKLKRRKLKLQKVSDVLQKLSVWVKHASGAESVRTAYCHPESDDHLYDVEVAYDYELREKDGSDISNKDPAAEPGYPPAKNMETKPQEKSFTLITPTVHTGFSFSIMHLLSAVRMAMISRLPKDSVEASKPEEGQNGKQECGVDNNVDLSMQTNTRTLTVQEIVERVKLKPGDPCILETQEPLQDLIRGVLRILSSKTAPLGAKGWKTLVQYEKSTKGWSWIGPAPAPHDPVELVASPEAWGLPHRMLIKLVDSFANWLKNGQEMLQLLGSLPEPPLALMSVNLDEKERFKDLRAQKTLKTLNPSSEEVRAYFRKEELLRYCIPDRAFSYTAADGKKSTVAPLRRCSGKPNSKVRDHFILKCGRPPHVTVLCLVRDAAARLPGSIGTRADVCTLIRDSQYIVEEFTDAQVNQVVSGALDRLHYERDPCVQFDSERKLWVYLHREREEEDFEDDGTSSTKKWKRHKKVSADQSEEGAVTVAPPATEDQPRPDLASNTDIKIDMENKDSRQNRENNVVMCLGNEIQWLSSVVA